MSVTIRSFAKINLGLCIGASRPDGFHDLRTVYQTIALHDIIRLQVTKDTGIEIRCEDTRVPRDKTNTCYQIAERVMATLGAQGRVIIEIDKRLPIQGGLGGASGNAVSVLLALEQVLKKRLSHADRLRIASEVGSDLPLFLIGGTSLGVGRGEEVFPVPDLPATSCVIATPNVAVSTPKAFSDWDKLTPSQPSDRMNGFSRKLSAWLSGSVVSGVSGKKRGGRAETLLDLVRTGIENDFEQVVFPQYPELLEVKRVLERAGASYASLSGSGSAIYGLFASRASAEKAARKLRKEGVPAAVTNTLTRPQYWKKVSSF
jgi:4-diphosphocytidyl-2-C-methyl-D-erythritol kinase